MLKLKFLISLLFLNSCLSIFKIPDEESFVNIDPHTPTFFELKEGQPEALFTFQNSYDDSDLIFTFQLGRHFSTDLYLYEAYSDIKVDSKGNYINFLSEFDLANNFNYVKSADTPLKKNRYYIIIKDRGNYPMKDVLTVYNEEDLVELKNGEPFIIRTFFSKGKYRFAFECEEDETINLELNIDKEDFWQYLSVSKDGESLYQGVRNKGIIKFNERKNTQGNYLVEISTEETPYQEITSTITLFKEKTKSINLLEGIEKKLVYGSMTKKFAFYVDITDYELNEENIITFKFNSHEITYKKYIEFCYAKNMNFEYFDDNKIISNMPGHEEESEADFSRLFSTDNVYHLYFKKTKENENDKKSYLLVYLSIRIDEEEEFFEPEQFSVFLSNRGIKYDLNDKKYEKVITGETKINKKIQLENYVPQVFEVDLPLDTRSSYVFYVGKKILTVYENSMLSLNTNNYLSNTNSHKSEIQREIYATSYETNKQNKLLFKLYGPSQEITFRIESTLSKIYYIEGEERPTKTFGGQHLNCAEGFYYIGSYSILSRESRFFLEEIYGEYKVYSRGEIKETDLSVLTNGKENYEIKEKTAQLNSHLDIVELKCKSPGYFNLHLLKTYFTRNMPMYTRTVEYFSKGATFIYPQTFVNQTDINIEISTPLGKQIDITCGDKKATIKGDNKYFQVKYDKAENVPSYIRLYATEATIISVRLTDENLFKKVETDHEHINEDKMLFKLKNSQDYKNFNLTLTRIYHNYTYTMFRGDPSFATDLIPSGYDFIDINYKVKVNLILSNPYIKPKTLKPDKEDSPFYIAFYVYDPEGIQKDTYLNYTLIEEKYDPITVDKPIIISSDNNEKYSLSEIKKDTINIIYQSCGNTLKEVNIYSYDDKLNTFDTTVTKKYNVGIISYYQIPMQLQSIFQEEMDNPYGGVELGISTQKITEEDIDKFNRLYLAVRQNGKTIKWDTIDGEDVSQYEIYLLNKYNDNVQFLHNPCYLKYIRDNQNILNINANDENYVKYYTVKENSYELKEEGNYTVIVAAKMEGKIPMRYIYMDLNYDSSQEPYEEETSKTALIVVISVISVIAIIAIIVVVVYFVRKYKTNLRVTTNFPPDESTKLVTDNTNSVSLDN